MLFDLIDDDKVCLTNLNRQIIATRKTVGKYKADVMKERILEINPDCQVEVHKCFFLPENADEFHFEDYDYVVDAVDTVTAKIEIIMKHRKKVPKYWYFRSCVLPVIPVGICFISRCFFGRQKRNCLRLQNIRSARTIWLLWDFRWNITANCIMWQQL